MGVPAWIAVLVAGGDDHEPERRARAREEVEDVQRGLVGRVEVVEEQVDRAPVGDGAQRLLDRVEDARRTSSPATPAPGAAPASGLAKARARARLLGERVRRTGRTARRRRRSRSRTAPPRRAPARAARPRRRAASCRRRARRGGRASPSPARRATRGGAASARGRAPAAGRPCRAAAAPRAGRRRATGCACDGPDLAALDRGAERARLLGGAERPARAERDLAGVVLAERLGAPAGLGEEAHERAGAPPRVAGSTSSDAAEERDRDRGVAALAPRSRASGSAASTKRRAEHARGAAGARASRGPPARGRRGRARPPAPSARAPPAATAASNASTSTQTSGRSVSWPCSMSTQRPPRIWRRS